MYIFTHMLMMGIMQIQLSSNFDKRVVKLNYF